MLRENPKKYWRKGRLEKEKKEKKREKEREREKN